MTSSLSPETSSRCNVSLTLLDRRVHTGGVVRVVVTGSAGFLGRALVRELGGHDVVGIDRAPQPNSPGHAAITADLLDDDERVRIALGAADVVFHLAGCPDVRDPRPDADHWRRRDNVLATEAVLAMVPLRTRLIVTSSSSVYGGSDRGRPSVERDVPRPRGGYATSKVMTERLCEARREMGGDMLIVRPFTVAGEGQRPAMALSRWIAAARAGLPLRVLGSLERSRDVTDVSQVVRALGQLADTGAGGVVNLGTGIATTLGEMVAAVQRVLGVQATVDVVPAASAEVQHTLADTRRLRDLLGWVPTTNMDDLIARQSAAMAADQLVHQR